MKVRFIFEFGGEQHFDKLGQQDSLSGEKWWRGLPCLCLSPRLGLEAADFSHLQTNNCTCRSQVRWLIDTYSKPSELPCFKISEIWSRALPPLLRVLGWAEINSKSKWILVFLINSIDLWCRTTKQLQRSRWSSLVSLKSRKPSSRYRFVWFGTATLNP